MKAIVAEVGRLACQATAKLDSDLNYVCEFLFVYFVVNIF